MSAHPKRRDLELSVIDAAIALDTMIQRAPHWKVEDFDLFEKTKRDLHTAVLGYCAYGLAEPSRTRTVLSAPDTSHEAGEWMKQFALTDACAVFRQIYWAWRNGPREETVGLTCDDVERRLDRSHQTISPRINELRDTGWIIDSGVRRKTRSGRAAIVWTPTRAAIDLVDRAGLPIPVTNMRKQRDNATSSDA